MIMVPSAKSLFPVVVVILVGAVMGQQDCAIVND